MKKIIGFMELTGVLLKKRLQKKSRKEMGIIGLIVRTVTPVTSCRLIEN